MKINTEIEFAASILVGSENYGRTCINGLPLTPSSIRLLGRFKHLLELKHEHLCTYIELIRAQNAANACFVVSEHYVKVLDCKTLSKKDLETVILQLMSATSYCHDEDVVIGHLTTGNILITHSCDGVCVKLSQYGLNHISGNGVDVDYLIADFYYLSPERVAKLGISTSKSPASKKSDSWAIGIIMVELYLKITLSDLWSIQQFISILQSFCHKMNTQTDSFLSHLLEAIKIANSEIDINIDENVKILIDKCLQLSSLKRSSIKEAWGFAKEVYKFQESTVKEGEFDKHMQMIEKLLSDANLEGVIVDRPLNELFFLWKLCGSNIEAILKPAEHKFARCVIDDFILLGDVLENDCLNSYDAILLPSSNLKSRLKALQYQNTYFDDGTDLVETPNKFVHNLGQTLIVKERDIDYQAYRMRLMKDLLDAFPYSSHMLKTECKKDIPPVYRGALWSALLNVNDSVYIDFKQLNTYAEHPADRQLQVDIPRCHQYEELMTSPAAHMKLKRLLKAWLLANPDYVYWQGLDSLAAPFLVHHFNDLPRAYGCLQNFISSVYAAIVILRLGVV
uniref:TBC domain-containing protein kinase-like protein n=1 Tax=Rhabditophanes sp. KR3021 TaxID=114890 RepID=A0AC35U7P7_9BILA